MPLLTPRPSILGRLYITGMTCASSPIREDKSDMSSVSCSSQADMSYMSCGFSPISFDFLVKDNNNPPPNKKKEIYIYIYITVSGLFVVLVYTLPCTGCHGFSTRANTPYKYSASGHASCDCLFQIWQRNANGQFNILVSLDMSCGTKRTCMCLAVISFVQVYVYNYLSVYSSIYLVIYLCMYTFTYIYIYIYINIFCVCLFIHV